MVNGPSWVAGKHGNAVSLDGVDDYLTVLNSASLDVAGSALTLSAWVNPLRSPATRCSLASSGAAMTNPFYQYGLELDGGGASLLRRHGWGSDRRGRAVCRWAVEPSGGRVQRDAGAVLPQRGADGDEPVNASITARGNVRIGADANTQQFFKGSIDDLRIYSRALTAAEVQGDMNAGL